MFAQLPYLLTFLVSVMIFTFSRKTILAKHICDIIIVKDMYQAFSNAVFTVINEIQELKQFTGSSKYTVSNSDRIWSRVSCSERRKVIIISEFIQIFIFMTVLIYSNKSLKCDVLIYVQKEHLLTCLPHSHVTPWLEGMVDHDITGGGSGKNIDLVNIYFFKISPPKPNTIHIYV